MRQEGFAGAEYLAIVTVVGVAMVGLVTLRPQEVSRRPPVDALTPIIRLLEHPAENLAPRKRLPRPGGPLTGPRPRRPDPPKPRADDPVVVPLPEWWGRR